MFMLFCHTMKLGLDQTSVQHLEQQLTCVWSVGSNQLVVLANMTLLLKVGNYPALVTNQHTKCIRHIE